MQQMHKAPVRHRLIPENLASLCKMWKKNQVFGRYLYLYDKRYEEENIEDRSHSAVEETQRPFCFRYSTFFNAAYKFNRPI